LFREPIDEPEYTTQIIPSQDQSSIISSLIDEIQNCDQDFDALAQMYNNMRNERNLWQEVAENLAIQLGKKEYANAEYENCKEVAQGIAW
jgi:hypothetical protein